MRRGISSSRLRVSRVRVLVSPSLVLSFSLSLYFSLVLYFSLSLFSPPCHAFNNLLFISISISFPLFTPYQPFPFFLYSFLPLSPSFSRSIFSIAYPRNLNWTHTNTVYGMYTTFRERHASLTVDLQRPPSTEKNERKSKREIERGEKERTREK